MSRSYILFIIILLFTGITGAGAIESSDAGCAFLSSSDIFPADANTNMSGLFGVAPLSPSFISYLENQDMAGGELQTLKHGLGAIPSPFYRPELTDAHIDILSIQEFNSSFDLRDVDKVTPVRDQGIFGTCWAHSSLASLESYLLPEENRSFSPKNMVNLNGFDYEIDDGGHVFMATAYLTRWNGPVDEVTDPYPEKNWTSSEEYPPEYHVQNVIIYPDRSDRNDTTSIKAGLMYWGTASVGFYWNETFYNASSAGYYQPKTAENLKPGGGHMVSLIGWNDTFPASAFQEKPPGDGAWIVKNSWGTYFGDEGYFYVSYYDKYFGSVSVNSGESWETAFVTGEPIDNYDQIYLHDPLGACMDYYIGHPKTGMVASRFLATNSGKISAIGFFSNDMNTHYKAVLYRNADDGPVGTKAAEFEGNLSWMGYHTVALPHGSEVPVKKGEYFSVALYLENEVYDYPIAMEQPLKGYSSNASANPEETYYYDIGSGSFVDLTDYNPNISACLRAYVLSDPSPMPAPEPLSASFTAKPVKGKAPLTVSFTDTSSGNPSHWIWNFGTGLQSMVQNPEITYTEPGQYTVSLLIQRGKEVDKVTKYHLITVQENSESNER